MTRQAFRGRWGLLIVTVVSLAGSPAGWAVENLTGDAALPSAKVNNPPAVGGTDLSIAAKGITGSSTQAAASGQTGVTRGPSKAIETHAGVPAGFTEDGYPFLGDPNAPVVLEEFSDYLCPYCGRYFTYFTLPGRM